MSVFVSIAAYRDPLLRFTLEGARDNARRPDDLHFGIVDQSDLAFEPPAQASYVRIEPAQARGPCWARAIAMSFYRGEDWFLQVDSHMDFEQGWDERLAEQARALSAGRKGVVLSTYPSPFVFEDGKPVRKPVTQKVLALVVIKGKGFIQGHWTVPFEAHPVETDDPMPGYHLGAGCLFATGRIALDFPYDPALYFHGEEHSLALRLFTSGWDIFHTPGMPIFHLYTQHAIGVDRPLHWDVEEDAQRRVKWGVLEERSRARMGALVSGAPLGVYGLGSERTLADYAAFSGIDYPRRRVEMRAYQPARSAPRAVAASFQLGTTTSKRENWSG
jgi:hypothetical protein